MELEYYVPEDFASDDSFVNYCFEYEPKDVAFWEQWLADHPERKEIAKRARELVFLTSIKATPEEKEAGWEKIKISLENISAIKHPSPKRQLNMLSKTGALASIILIVALMTIVIYWMAGESALEIRKSESLTEQYTTFSGQRRKVVLNDGTQVWLNADSRLICSSGFDKGSEREVSLSGEAYFKVASDPDRPFVIHTQKLEVRVLGTEFNIEAYPGENKEVAALIRGSIQVSLRADPGKKIILKPEEKITVLNNTFLPQSLPSVKRDRVIKEKDKLIIAPLITDPLLDSGTVETAWMEGKLVFRNEPFNELARQLERWYNVQIYFANDSLKHYCFTGIFSTETINQALQALQMTSPSDPFSYRIEGHEVFIDKDNPSASSGQAAQGTK